MVLLFILFSLSYVPDFFCILLVIYTQASWRRLELIAELKAEILKDNLIRASYELMIVLNSKLKFFFFL